MNERLKKKKRMDSPEPTAVIRELMAQPGIKKVRVFKNGDPYHQGVQMVINDRQVPDLNIFLAAVTRRIDLPFGAKKLYTTNGTSVKDIRQIKDGKDYVASSGLFTPQSYVGQAPRSRAKSVEPEKKKKRKKKRAASVAPARHVEIQKEEKKHKEEEEGHKPKKVKKIKKKREEHSGTRPVTRNEKEKPEEHTEHVEHKKKEGHHARGESGHGEVRSVSRYAHRPPTRAESRMHWKDESIDEDDIESVDEHDHQELDNESEKEGILPSEIHIPFDHSLNLEEKRRSIVSRANGVHEEAVKTKDEMVEAATKSKENAKEAVEKRKKSIYHWGDLNSFTKNIESLLKRKE